jgi:hypothetical protein
MDEVRMGVGVLVFYHCNKYLRETDISLFRGGKTYFGSWF